MSTLNYQVINCGHFPNDVLATDGDSIKLYINGNLVHIFNIIDLGCKKYNYFEFIKTPNGFGYLISFKERS